MEIKYNALNGPFACPVCKSSNFSFVSDNKTIVKYPEVSVFYKCGNCTLEFANVYGLLFKVSVYRGEDEAKIIQEQCIKESDRQLQLAL